MNAFALHDVSDQAAVRRWGASAMAIVAAHAALIALAMNWYTQRPEPGVSMPAIMVDMAPVSSSPQPTPDGPRAGTCDAAGGCLAAGARGCGSRAGTDRADPAAGEAGGRCAAGAEAAADAAKARAGQARSGPEAGAGEAESRSPGREEAYGGTAGAAHDGAAARPNVRRRPRRPPAPAHRPRRWPPTVSCVRAHLMRFNQYPPAAKAAGQQGTARVSFTLSRSGQVLSSRPRRLLGPSGARCRDPGDGPPRRSRFPPFPPEMKQGSMPLQHAGGVQAPLDPIPSPRRSATTRNNPRTANKTARPAASRAANPPSARPTGRRRRRRARSGSRPAPSCWRCSG